MVLNHPDLLAAQLLADAPQPWKLPNGRRWRINLEAPEWKKPYLQAGGKALGALRKLGCESTRVDWIPVRVYLVAGAARPSLLIEWDPKNGWKLHREALRAALPQADLDALDAALRQDQ